MKAFTAHKSADTEPNPTLAGQERRQREAEALRENLARRKAQARTRRVAQSPEAEAEPDSPD